MSNPSTEALIWIAVLQAAIWRAGQAQSPYERLAAHEAIHEARLRLDDALAHFRGDVALSNSAASSELPS